jgi:hypothetical protein
MIDFEDLFCSEDKMHARIRPHWATHLADFQPKSRVLKWFLHLPASKRPEVSPALGRTAVAEFRRQFLERLLATFDLLLEFWNQSHKI